LSKYNFYAEKKISPMGGYFNKIITHKMVKLVSRYSGAVQKILEIGPGKGGFAKCYLKQFPDVQYCGYEPSEMLYNNLKADGLNVKQKGIPPIAEADNLYNGIILQHVIEHSKDSSEAFTIINECYRVLAPGGILFLVFPNFMDWKLDFYNLDYTHKFPATESNVEQILKDANFEILLKSYHYGPLDSYPGRMANCCTKLIRSFLTALLPRSIGRSVKMQKMGVLFAENAILIGRKCSA
jgi:2-polyprenyl-3-methyl-5-hydroxy-6-metoxy-1,4-benzoquinol methylase